MKTRKQRVYRKRITKRRRLRVNNKGKNIRNRTRTKTLKKQKRIKGGGFFSKFRKPPEKVHLPNEDVYAGIYVKYKRDVGTRCNDNNLITTGQVIRLKEVDAFRHQKVIVVKPYDAVDSEEEINLNQICSTFNRVGELMDPNKIHRNSRSPKANINTSKYLKNPTND